ncbi:MAG: hypothetical protein KAW51_03110 [Candidatus Lokiarchaeota archaeon]|nr:hypothetical protein [Candidatus Lokiarchaeota archaeon]
MVLKLNPKIYIYLDGNGNKYIVNDEIIEYIPMKPSLSSSGYYNGGNYIKKEISNLQYNQLVSTLNIAIKNKKSHIKNRVKASGMIIIQDKNKENKCILNPNSKEVQNIETLLHDTISN